MTDDKPYRSVISAGRSPFQAPRAELVAELVFLTAYRPEGFGDRDLGLDLGERMAIEKAMKARACELLRALYPFRPTADDWDCEDIITSRAHETGIDVHEAPPSAEYKLTSEQGRAVNEALFSSVELAGERELKLRELARDLLDALHMPTNYDRSRHDEKVRLIAERARTLAEFILGERE